MELEIMQLEICSARCVVSRPQERCAPALYCIEIQNKNLQVENLCKEKQNLTPPPSPPYEKVLQC